MAKIKINGDSSGYVEIAAPNAANNNTLEIGSGTKILTNHNLNVGNVGIGTDNPGQELEVFSDDFAGIRLKSTRTGLTQQIGGIGFSTTSDQVATINALVDGTVLIKNTINDTERLRINSAGHILPGADNTQDLGSSAKRFANIYTGDLNLSNEGAANDVDGTWGQYTIQEGEDDLFLINRRSGKKYKFILQEVN